MTATTTAGATLAQFDGAWAELDGTVRSLSERDLTEVRDPAGWSAKDHLMHVALWERSLLATADGAPRHAALGVDPSTDGSEDYDAINAAIFQATRHRPLPEVLDTLAAAYAEMGDFPKAIGAAERAVFVAVTRNQPALEKEIRARLEMYRAGKAYREAR